MEKIVLLNDKVAAKQVIKETKSAGGIIIPPPTNNAWVIEADVSHVGTKCESQVKPGDRIIFDKKYAVEVMLNDEKLFVINEQNILFVTTEDNKNKKKSGSNH